MGGSGSGRYSGWGRYTTDDCHHIAAGELARTAKDFLSGVYSSPRWGGRDGDLEPGRAKNREYRFQLCRSGGGVFNNFGLCD